jgi:Na+-transporting NADH:ubiquinone oxidoreductase subunit NqrA
VAALRPNASAKLKHLLEITVYHVGKTIINHLFGNGKQFKHTTYQHGDDWGMVQINYYCLPTL